MATVYIRLAAAVYLPRSLFIRHGRNQRYLQRRTNALPDEYLPRVSVVGNEIRMCAVLANIYLYNMTNERMITFDS